MTVILFFSKGFYKSVFRIPDLFYRFPTTNIRLVCTILLLFASLSVISKSRSVQGVLLDDTGEKLVGASVKIKNSTIGVVTDTEDKFVLNFPGATTVLVFSYLGYNVAEISVGNQKTLSVILKPTSNTLADVVVIGYRTVQRKDITGSVAQVAMEDLKKAPVLSIQESLAGRLAGVQVSSSDGQPGAEVNIFIRDANSITQDNSSLYVVDGFPVEGFNLNVFNPQDIASKEVLKDASSRAIYGAREANGVVIITTKKGQEGALFNLYTPGDIRRDWAIAPFSRNNTTNIISYNYFNETQIYNRNSGKFRREFELSPVKSKNFTPINFPILRYADVLLMIAEAENQINEPTEKAYEALNQVRRRGFGYDPNVKAKVISKLKLTSSGNTGYLPTQTNVPITIIGGGGTSATGIATVNRTSGRITSVAVLNPGRVYTSVPQVIIGQVWSPNTEYIIDTQVSNGNNLYTVTSSGKSTLTAPNHTTGASTPTTTGAVFSYAGQRATATAKVANSIVDLSGLTNITFLNAIQDERSRELCFEALRRHDLIRWGLWVSTMNKLATDMKANAGSFAYRAIAGANITERNNLFPIPSSEILVNRAITQNPGW